MSTQGNSLLDASGRDDGPAHPLRVCDQRTCWLCEQPLGEVYWRQPRATRAHNSRYLRCRQCGLVTVSPYAIDRALGLEAPGHVNYVNNIEQYNRSISIAWFAEIVADIERVHYASGHDRPGALLEIGCAAGYLLDAARARDWQVRGVEPSATMVRWSREHLKLPIDQGFFENIALPDEHFDVVVAIETLEHVLEPLDFVARACRKLKAGGWLFVTTPNVYSRAYYPPRESTGILDPIDHLNLFSSETLAALLTRCELQNVRIEKFGRGARQLQCFAQKTRDGCRQPIVRTRRWDFSWKRAQRALGRLRNRLFERSGVEAARPRNASIH